MTRNRETQKKQGSSGSAERVLLAKEPDERLPLEESADFGWYLLGWIGLAFALVGGFDLALIWIPLGFGNPEWEFGTVSATLDGLPVTTLGLVLLLGVGAARGQRWLVRTMAVVFAVAALVILLAAVLYATLVPMAIQSMTDPVILLGLKKAIAKTTVQAVVYPVVFVWIAVKAWRHAATERGA